MFLLVRKWRFNLVKRIFWVDFAKGVTIFLVVVAHVCGQITNNLRINSIVDLDILRYLMYFSFLFIMPVFFALSGYLFKPVKNLKEYKKIVLKKVITIGIPYISFSVLLYIVSLVTGMHNEGVSGLSSLILILWKPYSYLWFLITLLYIFILINFLFLIRVSIYIQFFLYFILGISQAILFPNGSGLSQFFAWSLCFYVGFLLKGRNLLDKLTNKLFIIVVAIIPVILQFYFDNNWYEHANGFNAFNFIPKLLGILVLFFLYKKAKKNRFTIYFEKYGKVSLAIYLLHYPLLTIIRRGLTLLSFNNPFIVFLLCLILSWYGSIFCLKLFSKITPLYLLIFPNKYLKYN